MLVKFVINSQSEMKADIHVLVCCNIVLQGPLMFILNGQHLRLLSLQV